MSSSRSSSVQALFNRRAELCLRFVIVGAGLAGLAVAYNLRKAGHSVCVLEKADGVGKVRWDRRPLLLLRAHFVTRSNIEGDRRGARSAEYVPTSYALGTRTEAKETWRCMSRNYLSRR